MTNVAPKDGTVLACADQSLPLQQAMRDPSIQFDAKGQNVNIKAAAVENFKRKPTVVMPLDSAAAPLVFPMPGWNDKRRT